MLQSLKNRYESRILVTLVITLALVSVAFLYSLIMMGDGLYSINLFIQRMNPFEEVNINGGPMQWTAFELSIVQQAMPNNFLFYDSLAFSFVSLLVDLPFVYIIRRFIMHISQDDLEESLPRKICLYLLNSILVIACLTFANLLFFPLARFIYAVGGWGINAAISGLSANLWLDGLLMFLLRLFLIIFLILIAMAMGIVPLLLLVYNGRSSAIIVYVTALEVARDYLAARLQPVTMFIYLAIVFLTADIIESTIESWSKKTSRLKTQLIILAVVFAFAVGTVYVLNTVEG